MPQAELDLNCQNTGESEETTQQERGKYKRKRAEMYQGRKKGLAR